MSAVPQSKSELLATVYTSTDLAMHLLKQAVNREQIGQMESTVLLRHLRTATASATELNHLLSGGEPPRIAP